MAGLLTGLHLQTPLQDASNGIPAFASGRADMNAIKNDLNTPQNVEIFGNRNNGVSLIWRALTGIDRMDLVTFKRSNGRG
jgi:hypothetical protein